METHITQIESALPGIIVVAGLLLTVFGLAEILYKKGVAPDITRKVAHIGGGVVTALMPFFISPQTAVVFGMTFFLLLMVSKRNNFLGSVHGNGGDSAGAPLFALSLTLCALIFWPIDPLLFQGVAAILAFSDGAAGIAGRRLGKRKFNIVGGKSWEGSAVFFFLTLLLLAGFELAKEALGFRSLIPITAGALLITLSEAFFSKGWDNLSVPLVSGAVLYFLLQ